MPNNGQPLHQLSFLAESHEDRLQKVEENLSEVAVAVGKMQTTQEYMSEQQENSSKVILATLNGIDSKLDSFETRLSPIEAEQKLRNKRSKTIKTVLKGIVAATGGAIAAGAGAWIWELIKKGF